MKIEITATIRGVTTYLGEFEFPAVPRQGDEVTMMERTGGGTWEPVRVIRTSYTVQSVCWGLDRDERDRYAEVFMNVREINREEV